MAGHGCGMFGWSWIEASVLGSQVFGQASMEGCESQQSAMLAGIGNIVLGLVAR